MSGFGCENLPYGTVVFALLLNCIFLVGNVTVLIQAWNYLSNRTKLTKNVRITGMATYFSFVMASVGCLFTITQFFICPTQRFSSYLHLISLAVTMQLVSLSLVLLQILFTLRLLNAFDDSILDISKKLKYTLWSLCIVEIVSYVSILLCRVFLLTNYNPNNDNEKQSNQFKLYSSIMGVLFTILVVVYLTHFTLLGINFRSKLKQFAILLDTAKNGGSNNNNNNDNTNDKSSTTKRKMTGIMLLTNKLFVCWLFAFISTLFVNGLTLVAYIMSIGTMSDYSITVYIITPLSYTFINFDTFINNIALAMQFEFGQTLYNKLCLKCDNKARNCFETKTVSNTPDLPIIGPSNEVSDVE